MEINYCLGVKVRSQNLPLAILDASLIGISEKPQIRLFDIFTLDFGFGEKMLTDALTTDTKIRKAYKYSWISTNQSFIHNKFIWASGTRLL